MTELGPSGSTPAGEGTSLEQPQRFTRQRPSCRPTAATVLSPTAVRHRSVGANFLSPVTSAVTPRTPLSANRSHPDCQHLTNDASVLQNSSAL